MKSCFVNVFFISALLSLMNVISTRWSLSFVFEEVHPMCEMFSSYVWNVFYYFLCKDSVEIWYICREKVFTWVKNTYGLGEGKGLIMKAFFGDRMYL